MLPKVDSLNGPGVFITWHKKGTLRICSAQFGGFVYSLALAEELYQNQDYKEYVENYLHSKFTDHTDQD